MEDEEDWATRNASQYWAEWDRENRRLGRLLLIMIVVSLLILGPIGYVFIRAVLKQ